jgi:hypothetical protein
MYSKRERSAFEDSDSENDEVINTAATNKRKKSVGRTSKDDVEMQD